MQMSATVVIASRCSSTVRRPSPIVFTDTWVAPAVANWTSSSANRCRSPCQVMWASMPMLAGSRPAAIAEFTTISRASSSSGPGDIGGNHPSATRPARSSAGRVMAPIHTGIGPCTGDPMMRALKGQRLLGPQPPHQLDLFIHSLATVAEFLSESLVFDGVPADPDTKAQPPLAQQIDLGGLFGDQDRLPLRQDDHLGHQLQCRGDRSEIAEHDQRFVEGGVHVVRTVPTGVYVGIGTNNVVVGHQMTETKLFDTLAVGTHRRYVTTELGLGKHHANSHTRRQRTNTPSYSR